MLVDTLDLLQDQVDVRVDERANQVPLAGLIHTHELGTVQDSSKALLVELTDVTLLLLLGLLGLGLLGHLLLGRGLGSLGLGSSLSLRLGRHRHRHGLWLDFNRLLLVRTNVVTISVVVIAITIAVVVVDAALSLLIVVVAVRSSRSWCTLPPLHLLRLLFEVLLVTVLRQLG